MIYLGCALTVLIEEIVFAAAGFSSRQYFIPLCAAVNVATNLTLNLILSAYYSLPLLFALEALVVVLEYAAYAAAYGRDKKLFICTFAANLASFMTGVVLFGI